MFGGRHVQVLTFEPSVSNFELISVRDYRGVGAPPVSGDNVYFAVVLRNPVAKGYILFLGAGRPRRADAPSVYWHGLLLRRRALF